MKRVSFLLMMYSSLIFGGISAIASVEFERYDTDLAITNYKINIEPHFTENRIDIQVITDVLNVSGETKTSCDFQLLSGNAMSVMKSEIHGVSLLSAGGEQSLAVSGHGDDSPGDFTVHFTEPLGAGKSIALQFDYSFVGKDGKNCLALSGGNDEELYFITDVLWLPMIQSGTLPGRFNNIYKPGWELTVIHPIETVSVASGDFTGSKIEDGKTIDTWRSVINDFPQVFVADYEGGKVERDTFSVELYFPAQMELDQQQEYLGNSIARVLELYASLYGDPGYRTYRLVASHTNLGGHGMYMGAGHPCRHLPLRDQGYIGK